MTSPTKEVRYDFYRPTDAASYRFSKHIKGLGDSSHRADRDDSKLLAGEAVAKECHCYYLFNNVINTTSRYVYYCVS